MNVYPGWLTLYDGLPYEKAVRKAAKIKREEAKLRSLGCAGNYSAVEMRVSWEGPHGRKGYAIYVKPIGVI